MRYKAVTCWSNLQWSPEAYRLVTLFRAANPLLGNVEPHDLHWEVLWSEKFIPLDMSLDAPERARVRVSAVFDVRLSCALNATSLGPSCAVEGVPAYIYYALVDKETERAP